MIILAYQAFIVFTILIVRFVSKKYLVTICIAWTAFTFLNVFYSPLMLLQLLTIWSFYALLNPRNKKPDIACSDKLSETNSSASKSISAPKQLAPLHSPPLARTVTQGAVVQGMANAHRALDSVLGAAASFMSELGDQVTLASAVQKATSELSSAIAVERILIEGSLISARVEQKFRKKHDPEAWSYYQQAQADLTQLLKKDVGVSAPVLEVAPPEFRPPQKHVDPKIAEAIDREILSLKDKRDSFLSGTVKELWADDDLREVFVTKLHKVGGAKIWIGIFAFACRKLGVENALLSAKIASHQESAEKIKDVLADSKSATGARAKTTTRLIFNATLDTVPATPFDLAALLERRKRHIADAKDLTERLVSENTEGRAVADLAVTKSGGGGSYKDCLFEQGEKVELPYFLHFTRAENLPSIMQHGLCSVAMLNDRAIHYYENDRLRLDGHLDAISISIAHPNDKMFARYRWKNTEQDWAVLVLDRSILWMMDAAFCKHNAADNRIRKHPVSNFITVRAFDAMFLASDELPSREESHLMPFDPTDVQAELLVFGTIQPEFINGVVFSHAHALEKYKGCLGQRRISIHANGQGFFGPRSYARKSGWAP